MKTLELHYPMIQFLIIPNIKVIKAYAATVQAIHPSPTSSYPSTPYSTFLLLYPLSGLLSTLPRRKCWLNAYFLHCVTSYSTTVDTLRCIPNHNEKVKKKYMD